MPSILLLSSIATALLVFLTGCTGLDPNVEPPFSGIRGVVRYVGGAPGWTTDSIYDLRVVAFETKPSVPGDVIASIIQQTSVFSPEPLPRRVDSTVYEIKVLAAPRSFTYVVVAMQNGPNFQTDWVMLDVYAPSGDPTRPGIVNVPSGGVVTVDFRVDFANLPPQPFE